MGGYRRSYYGGYYGYPYRAYGYYGKKKRSADAEPVAEPNAEANADAWYGYYGHGLGYGYGHRYGYGGYYGYPYRAYGYYGKRSADAEPAAEPNAEADADAWYGYYGHGLGYGYRRGYYGGYYGYPYRAYGYYGKKKRSADAEPV